MLNSACEELTKCTCLLKKDELIIVWHLNSCHTCCNKQARIYHILVSISIIVVKI